MGMVTPIEYCTNVAVGNLPLWDLICLLKEKSIDGCRARLASNLCSTFLITEYLLPDWETESFARSVV